MLPRLNTSDANRVSSRRDHKHVGVVNAVDAMDTTEGTPREAIGILTWYYCTSSAISSWLLPDDASNRGLGVEVGHTRILTIQCLAATCGFHTNKNPLTARRDGHVQQPNIIAILNDNLNRCAPAVWLGRGLDVRLNTQQGMVGD